MAEAPDEDTPVTPAEFDTAIDEVFATNAGLFDRLAQAELQANPRAKAVLEDGLASPFTERRPRRG